jgi:hypothetical protein
MLTQLLGDGPQTTEITFVPTTLNAGSPRRLPTLPRRLARGFIAAGVGAVLGVGAVGWFWLNHEQPSTPSSSAFAAPNLASPPEVESERLASKPTALERKVNAAPKPQAPLHLARPALPAHPREHTVTPTNASAHAPNATRGTSAAYLRKSER